MRDFVTVKNFKKLLLQFCELIGGFGSDREQLNTAFKTTIEVKQFMVLRTGGAMSGFHLKYMENNFKNWNGKVSGGEIHREAKKEKVLKEFFI